jgi:hypothetical protein
MSIYLPNALVRVLCGLLCLLLILATAACDVVASAHYKPPFVPVLFSIDTAGHISVEATAAVTTPVGEFSVSGGAVGSLKPPDDGLLVLIQRVLDGSPSEAAFQLNEDDEQVTVVVDGKSTLKISNRRVEIDAINGRVRTVLVSSPNAQTSADTPAALPPTDVPEPPPSPTPVPTLAPAYMNLFEVNDCPIQSTQAPPYRWPSFHLLNISNRDIQWLGRTDAGSAVSLDPSQGTITQGDEITVRVNGAVDSSQHSPILAVSIFDATTGKLIPLNGATAKPRDIYACGFP